jgi:hypothetical protein
MKVKINLQFKRPFHENLSSFYHELKYFWAN